MDPYFAMGVLSLCDPVELLRSAGCERVEWEPVARQVPGRANGASAPHARNWRRSEAAARSQAADDSTDCSERRQPIDSCDYE